MFKLFITSILFCLISTLVFTQSRKIDSLKLLLETRGKDTVRVNILNQLSREVFYANQKDYLAISLEQKQLSEQLNYRKGIARSLLNIGNYHNINGNADSAFVYYRQSLKLYKPLGELNQIGKLFYTNPERQRKF
jgi:hypothetical protein